MSVQTQCADDSVPMNVQRYWARGLGGLALGGLGLAMASPPTLAQACPTDLPVLMDHLLRDLPTYAGLVAQRSSGSAQFPRPVASVVAVGVPEFEPIDLTSPFPPPESPAGEVQQVFFTTLERQPLTQDSVLLQHYHWLLLAPGEEGWQPVLLYSSLGDYPASGPPTPPQANLNGVVGQAVRLWLRDCRAGAVELEPPTPVSPAPEFSPSEPIDTTR